MDRVVRLHYGGDQALYQANVTRAIRARDHEVLCISLRQPTKPHRYTNGLG